MVGVFLLVLLLPSVVSDKLINGTQSGKFFFFGYSILVLAGIFSISQLFLNNRPFGITIIDIFFAAFILWISVNKFLLHEIHSFSFRYFELLLLGVFYLITRNIQAKYYTLLLIAVCIGAIVQAAYGNLQLWGLFPSRHGLFPMTGSFFNPGPYSGYLCGILPIAVGLFWMLKPDQSSKVQTIKLPILYSLFRLIAIATIVSILLVLPAARSRAAWLGIIAGILFLAWHRYNLNLTIRTFLNGKNNFSPLRKLGVKTKRILLGSATIILISATCLGLYHFKKGSADGRILIWTVTTNIIKDHPILGVGQDQFKAYYNDYQADYFRTNNGSPYETLAADNQYAFNEFLNIWVENGIVGFLLFALLLFSIFKSNTNLKNGTPIILDDGDLNSNKKLQLPQLSIIQSTSIIKASLLSIVVFGCFAYPSEILPIKMVAVAGLAMLSSLVFKYKKGEAISPKSMLNPLWMRISFSLISIAIVLLAFTHLNKLKTACTTWNNAYNLYSAERYEVCLKEYGKAFPELKNNGDFLLNYGKALSIAGRHEKAIEVLERSKLYTTNSICHTSLGDNYLALNQNTKAEAAYINAHNITPAKFYPEYLLAKYYYKTGDIQKAKMMAQKVLQKQIKVKSKAIEEIFQEMQMILNDSYHLRTNTVVGKSIENNQLTHSEHSHEFHNSIAPYRLEQDTCSDDCAKHNHLNKKEVR